jgi:hypothetical protein
MNDKPLFFGLERVVRYGSHLPLLMYLVERTQGPIVELGMGMNSSLYLHWACALARRPLVSYEDNPHYRKWQGHFATDWHQVHLVENWDQPELERDWTIALVDHDPSERRITDIRRLAPYSQYLVIHDTEGRRKAFYHYEQIWPLFRWKLDLHDYRPKTSVVSNVHDLQPLYAHCQALGAQVTYEDRQHV